MRYFALIMHEQVVIDVELVLDFILEQKLCIFFSLHIQKRFNGAASTTWNSERPISYGDEPYAM